MRRSQSASLRCWTGKERGEWSEVLHYTTLHYTAVCYTALHYTYTTLHYLQTHAQKDVGFDGLRRAHFAEALGERELGRLRRQAG